MRCGVRGTLWETLRDDLLQGLLPVAGVQAKIELTEAKGTITNGAITAEVSGEGRLRFLRSAGGDQLSAEVQPHFSAPPIRHYQPAGGGMHRFQALFEPNDNERFYGLGQHQHGLLDQKGAVVELVQRNTEVSVPLLVSSLGYGFLRNHPGVGRVELAANGTRWVAEALQQFDYWVTAGDEPAQIVRNYAEVTGKPPAMPYWATGFWQCKLRYRTQEELLEVAREYRRRGGRERAVELRRPPPPDPRRAQHGLVRHTLVDHRHRWFSRGRCPGRKLSGTARPVVPVRRVLASLPASRRAPARAHRRRRPDGSAKRSVVPIGVPAIVTVGLFAFLGAWNDFVNAFTLNNGGGPQPLTLGLYKFVTQYTTNDGGIFAAATLTAIPTTLLLFAGQRWIRGGLRAGALKG
jgi:hypothetical protein